MENYEKLLIVLEEFERSKSKEIPKELDDFIGIVAKTGNIIYPWVKIKSVYRSKIMSVLSQFFESFPTEDISQFSFESMKTKLLERFDQFISAPFTIQRLSELLINPRKEYNRIDKYMRAIEKNILVVSGVEPGCLRQLHLNGGAEMMEEGFQVSSTSVKEEVKEEVEAGIGENNVATETIAENGQGEEHKAEEICENKEEELKIEESDSESKEEGAGEVTDCNGNTSTQEKSQETSEESMMDDQENHKMEFASAETDSSAVAEDVSEAEEICKPDVSNSVEEPEKEFSQENTSVSDSSPDQTSDGPVISVVESCDTVAEVEPIAQSVPADEDMTAAADKSMETDEKVEEDMSMDTSPPKEESLPDDSTVEVKADSQIVDVTDVGSSMEVHAKTESDCEIPTKVLILSTPTEAQFKESMNCGISSESEVTEKGKEESVIVKPEEISSASEKLTEGESDDSHTVTPESNEAPEDSNVERSTSPDLESPVQAASPGDSSSCSQESANSPKIESS